MEQITYIKTGDYYIPDWKLPEEPRPIGRWGRMHKDYLKEHRPVVFNQLVLSGSLWTYLADINEHAQQRMEFLISQLKFSEGLTEELKDKDQMEWIYRVTRIQNHAEELLLHEIIFN